MSIVKNVVLCGYFYTKPEKRFRKKTVCEFYGNKISFIGNAIFLTVSKNIRYHLLETNVCKRLWESIEKSICCEAKKERLVFVSLEIVNIQCSLTLHCDRRRIISELLTDYKQSHDIADVLVVQENQGPEQPTRLAELTPQHEYLSLRVLSRAGTKTECVVKGGKKISIKFVRRRNINAVSLTVILTDFSASSLGIVDYFRGVSKRLAMYLVTKQSVYDNLLTCMKSVSRGRDKKHAHLRALRNERGLKKYPPFAQLLCQELFADFGGGELLKFGSLNEVSSCFGKLCEPLKCVLVVTSTAEGRGRMQKPRGSGNPRFIMDVLLMKVREENTFCPSFQLDEYTGGLSPSSKVQADAPVSVSSPPVDLLTQLTSELTGENIDGEREVLDGFLDTASDSAKREKQELDSHFHLNQLEPFMYMPESTRAETCTNTSRATCTISKAPESLQSNVMTMDDTESVDFCSSSSLSGGVSSSGEEEDEEEEDTPQPKKARTEQYVEHCISKGKGKRKEEQRAKQRRQLQNREQMETTGYMTPTPDLTRDFLATNLFYAENMQVHSSQIFQTFTNISILTTRLARAMKNICADNGKINCTVCPLHCADTVSELKIKSAGRPPAAACSGPNRKRGRKGTKVDK